MLNSELQELARSPDAEVWAEAFIKEVERNPQLARDRDVMIGWFANAMITGDQRGTRSEVQRYRW